MCVLLGGPGYAQPSFTGVGDLPGGYFRSEVFGVSADGGSVVGWSHVATGFEAFVWTPSGGIVGLGDLPEGNVDSDARAVSGDGSTVVGRGSVVPSTEAYLWTSGAGMVGLGDLPGGTEYSYAVDISADGSTVVGISGSASGAQSFHWTSATGMVGIADFAAEGHTTSSTASAVNGDGTTVVGSHPLPYVTVSERVAYRWNVGLDGIAHTPDDVVEDLGDLPGGRTYSSAVDVSDDGQVVVGTGTVGVDVVSLTEPFIWTPQTGMTSLGLLPGHNRGAASSVSGDGSTVLGSSRFWVPGGGERTPWIWDATNGMRELSAFLTAEGIDLTGWTLIGGITGGAFMSNDGNVIVGQGINPSGYTEAWVAILDVSAMTTGSSAAAPALTPLGVAALAASLGWVGRRARRSRLRRAR